MGRPEQGLILCSHFICVLVLLISYLHFFVCIFSLSLLFFSTCIAFYPDNTPHQCPTRIVLIFLNN